jgi:hypothetical protein
MKCKLCGSKMSICRLKASSFVGIYYYGHYCPKCKKSEDEVNRKIEEKNDN